ncbi:MAG: hypothetical protein U1E08_03255 [Coriobacteriia bacterium]|nr:hypothetical protein [Coriobacteriia bacterium]
MGSRISQRIAVGFFLAVALVAPAAAYGQGVSPSVSPTAPYELDFTLPTESKSGCLVCHGDPALVRVRDGVVMSYYIDDATIEASAHIDQQCVGCHLDFTYKAPHGNGEWVTTAKTACRNCHEEQSRAFGVGVHRATVPNGNGGSVETTTAPKPLCGDCHGSHDILMLTDNPDGQEAIHADGWEVCGSCHEDYWDSYDDYYHGAAYKRGAKDAPACWDCHGWHDILPSSERGSSVHESHLVETCGQEGCHVGVDENYTSYAVFIHGRSTITDDNPLIALVRSVIGAFGRLFGGGGE